MQTGKTKMKKHPGRPMSAPERNGHGRIFSVPDPDQCLDTLQLNRLEESFRRWVAATRRTDVRLARRRILLIFLLIRYTGAKLNEVLALKPLRDIDFKRFSVRFGRADTGRNRPRRTVQISAALTEEIRSLTADPALRDALRSGLDVDPGFVRRKFYERAQACGLPKHLGAPEMLRKSRAVELMRNNMPLPAVQMLLGHSTPNLTASYVSFSDSDIERVTRFFVEKEPSRNTSARNTFFGKIRTIERGDIQVRLELATTGGHRIATVITLDSLDRLGLKEGMLITSEVKAPWVMLQKGDAAPACTAENRFNGTVQRINPGAVNTEVVVRISDGTELCAVVTTESARRLALRPGDAVWALFNCFSVVLHAD
jgi:molybdate transport system regulatory protein